MKVLDIGIEERFGFNHDWIKSDYNDFYQILELDIGMYHTGFKIRQYYCMMIMDNIYLNLFNEFKE